VLNGGFLLVNFRSNSASSWDIVVDWTLNQTKKKWKKSQEAATPGQGTEEIRG